MFQHSNVLQVNVTLRLSLGTEHIEIQKMSGVLFVLSTDRGTQRQTQPA